MRAATVVLLSLCVTLAASSALSTGTFHKADAGSASVARESPRDAAAEGSLDEFEGRDSTRNWHSCMTFSETVPFYKYTTISPTSLCYGTSIYPGYILKYSVYPSGSYPYDVTFGDEQCPSANNNVMNYDRRSYDNGHNATKEVIFEAAFSSYMPKMIISCYTTSKTCTFTGELCFRALTKVEFDPDDGSDTPSSSGSSFNYAMLAPIFFSLFFVGMVVWLCLCLCKRRFVSAPIVGAAIALDRSYKGFSASQEYPQPGYPMEGFPTLESYPEKANSADGITTQDPSPMPDGNDAAPPAYAPQPIDYSPAFAQPLEDGAIPMLTLWQYKKSEPAASTEDAAPSEPRE